MANNELTHFGIKGMKWGIRRYQKPNGQRTVAGKARYDSDETQPRKVNKNPSVMSNVKTVVGRKASRMSERAKKLSTADEMDQLSDKIVSVGKTVVKKVATDVVLPAATDIGKQLVKSGMSKAVNDVLNLSDDYKVFANNKRK